MEDLTGKQLGRYQIVAPLGEGGMASVYKAYQPSVDRYVALKILPRHFAADPTFMGRFEQEAKVIANLQHPYILPVHDFGESEGYTYLVMQLIETGTLDDLLKGNPLSLDTIQRVISQVGEALDYAHSRGLIHRDVKPSNVLIDEGENCLLTDFGISKIVEATTEFTRTGRVIGTPTYMSPEQGMGEKVDARSDVYSLGVMLYEMATGQPPYNAETPVAIIFKHAYDPLPIPRRVNPALPESVEGVILKSLAKNPNDRHQSAGELVLALTSAIRELGKEMELRATDDVTVGVPPTTPPTVETQPGKPSRRPITRILTMAALVVMGVVIIVSGIGLVFSRLTVETPEPVVTIIAPATIFPAITNTPLLIQTPIPSPAMYGFHACLDTCLESGANAIRVFPEKQTKIYMHWRYENIPVGSHYVRQWTMAGEEWVRYECTWPGPENGLEENVTLTEPDGLHFGEWELTILIDGVVVLKEQIWVEGDWDYWHPAGYFDTCYGKK